METAIWSAAIAAAFGVATYVAQSLITKYLERKAVGTAILAEVQRLLIVVTTHQRCWQEWMEKKETQKHPLIPFSCDVYEKHVDNLGLVQPKYVGHVVQFYGHLKFTNALQAVRADEADFDDIYNRALQEIVDSFGSAFDKAFAAYHLD